MGEIYMIKNKINNKIYIGQTKQDAITRFGRHIVDRKKYLNRPFYKDLDEMGYLNFEVSVLEECQNKNLNNREKFYIKRYNSFNTGYNLTLGEGSSRKVDSQEVIKLYNNNINIKEIADKLDVCPKTISKCLKDNGIDIRKIPGTEQDVNAKAILQFNKNGKLLKRYYSAREAGRRLGDESKFSHIRECACGLRKTAYGYVWKWEK